MPTQPPSAEGQEQHGVAWALLRVRKPRAADGRAAGHGPCVRAAASMAARAHGPSSHWRHMAPAYQHDAVLRRYCHRSHLRHCSLRAPTRLQPALPNTVAECVLALNPLPPRLHTRTRAHVRESNAFLCRPARCHPCALAAAVQAHTVATRIQLLATWLRSFMRDQPSCWPYALCERCFLTVLAPVPIGMALL